MDRAVEKYWEPQNEEEPKPEGKYFYYYRTCTSLYFFLSKAYMLVTRRNNRMWHNKSDVLNKISRLCVYISRKTNIMVEWNFLTHFFEFVRNEIGIFNKKQIEFLTFSMTWIVTLCFNIDFWNSVLN